MAPGAYNAWLDFTRGTYSLRDATNATGSFVTVTVTPCDEVLGSTSIAMDSADHPHIGFPCRRRPSAPWATR